MECCYDTCVYSYKESPSCLKTDLLLTVLLTVHSLNQLKRQILFFGSLVKLLVLAVKL